MDARAKPAHDNIPSFQGLPTLLGDGVPPPPTPSPIEGEGGSFSGENEIPSALLGEGLGEG